MKPMRPYLLRGLYDWMLDNAWTPHIVVDAKFEGVEVPADFVQDGKITLNIHPQAVQGLVLGDEELTFSARFGGLPRQVRVPLRAVIGAFARESGRGLYFEDEPFDGGDGPPSPEPEKGPEKPGRRSGPVLRVIK